MFTRRAPFDLNQRGADPVILILDNSSQAESGRETYRHDLRPSRTFGRESARDAQTKVLYRTLGLSGRCSVTEQGMGTMEELHLEELSLRMTQKKMDDAFRTAMQRAIDAGEENTPTVVSKRSPAPEIRRA